MEVIVVNPHSGGKMPSRLICTVALLVLGIGQIGAAQDSFSGSRTGLDLVDVDLMFIGAHPDDDGGIMATFSRYLLDQGYKGTAITLTGGEGGANATGPELGRALGLIREEEERRSLSAIGIDNPHFLGLRDFYFTLSAEETEKMWGGNAFICDVIRFVRLQRPEVMVTMWPGPGTHGNHQEAARAATVAFADAGNPKVCPEQITDEYLKPFNPLKLYYYPNDDEDTTVSVPTDDVSRTLATRYADWKAQVLRNYRTQGYDEFSTVPAEEAAPEQFMLVRSRVPVNENETSLLEGALEAAGTSPAGMRLEVTTSSFDAGIGEPVEAQVTLINTTSASLNQVKLDLDAPTGWQVEAVQNDEFTKVNPGQKVAATFTLTAQADAASSAPSQLSATYSANQHGTAISGQNAGWIQAVPPVDVAFEPLYDVAGYRAFAAETQTEQVITSLPTRLPLVVGETNPVTVTVTNRSDAAVDGELSFDLPKGTTVQGTTTYTLKAHASKDMPFTFKVTDSILPQDMHAILTEATVHATSPDSTSSDSADVYALPALTIRQASTTPTIDGDLSDMQSAAGGVISASDLWYGETDSAVDSSAKFWLSYDDDNLYVGVQVTDQTVVCNIGPNDVRGFHRSDGLFVSIDPGGESADTSTVYQLGLFPCTTAGFNAVAARDGDANQGPIVQTAPDTHIASTKTPAGYTAEVSVPWDELPGDVTAATVRKLGVNFSIFDGDDENAEVGSNIRESSLSWSAFDLGGKQFLPYLWAHVSLGN